MIPRVYSFVHTQTPSAEDFIAVFYSKYTFNGRVWQQHLGVCFLWAWSKLQAHTVERDQSETHCSLPLIRCSLSGVRMWTEFVLSCFFPVISYSSAPPPGQSVCTMLNWSPWLLATFASWLQFKNKEVTFYISVWDGDGAMNSATFSLSLSVS